MSAEGSGDVDGEIVDYLWEFGDGSSATGPTASHVYAEPGEYPVTLAIRDDDGGEDFASSTRFQVSEFEFAGCFEPVANLPDVNTVKSGSAVPLKFGLAGDQGLEVPAGASGLTYDTTTDTYTYVWRTANSWVGSCRVVEMKLSDGSVHSALFAFR